MRFTLLICRQLENEILTGVAESRDYIEQALVSPLYSGWPALSNVSTLESLFKKLRLSVEKRSYLLN